MKKEVADLWVKALRSGQYRQTKSVLDDGNGYCCLGVLCRISGIAKTAEDDADGEMNRVYGESLGEQLAVKEWAGMHDDVGEFTPDDFGESRVLGFKDLASMNDGRNGQKPMTFAQIADVIEQHWSRL